MNSTLNHLREPASAAETGFNVVIACEDSATAPPACEVLELLEHDLPDEARLIYRWWNFEVLAITSLRQLASYEAATADLIIIAAHNGRELPSMVTKWIQQWLALRQGQPGALVAVLEASLKKSDGSRGMLEQLKKMAALGHLNFFATEAKEGSLEAEANRRDREAARQFVKACTKRGASRIVGRRGPKRAACPSPASKRKVQR